MTLKNKVVFSIVLLICIPISLTYALFWGVLAGILGTCLHTLIDWKKLMVGEYHEWKYLPKNLAIYWWQADKKTADGLLEKDNIVSEVKLGRKSSPHPILFFLMWTFFYLFLLFLRLPWAIISGPLYALEEAKLFFVKQIIPRYKG